jgi:hypothetical protein
MKSNGNGSKKTRIIPAPMKSALHFSRWTIKHLVSSSIFIEQD